ncbi:MAG: phosphate ABC transporter permease subunit PstC [Hyphomicrobiales bacterium]|nr:phosphate ABC transporter permease subunit PstC [Hyphomicrobiales bacterium]
MQTFTLACVLLVLTYFGFRMGRGRALGLVGGKATRLHSLPGYYGYYVALWCGIPAFLMVAAWLTLEPTVLTMLTTSSLPADVQSLSKNELGLVLNDIRNLASGSAARANVSPDIVAAAERYATMRHLGFAAMAVVALAVAVAGLTFARTRVTPDMRARNRVEQTVRVILIASSTIAILTTVGIVLSLLFESLRFFEKIPATDFLFGLEWSPQTALRKDQVGSSGLFGAIPLFAGTLLISFIAMCVAAPVGLLSAIYMSEYAHSRVRAVAKPMLEVLAGIPTVVYGFFAALTVAPFFRDTGDLFGLSISSESALAAGVVMGVMIIPFVSSLSDDVINAVPQAMREGSYGLGATQSETIRRVILPAALPGIVGGLLLAVSRAIGETMIVVMAAGLAANLTANPFEAVTTVTVQIVTLLVGDQEFDSAKTLAAFALGLVLFCVTLALNVVALTVVNKYREQYE